jgi:hypothetical protein
MQFLNFQHFLGSLQFSRPLTRSFNQCGETLSIQASDEQSLRENCRKQKGRSCIGADHDSNTWLVEAKLDEDILDWESARIDLRFSEIDAEIVESGMSKPDRFRVHTRGKSPVQKDDLIYLEIRNQSES